MSSSRVAVVTGANRGLGLAIVRALTLKFDGLVYLTSRNKERGQEAARELEANGSKVKYHQLDINDATSVNCFENYLQEQHGGLDVLINNAGVLNIRGGSKKLAENARLNVGTNFFGTLRTSNSLLPHVRENGRVVNVAGYVGLSALKECSADLQEEFKSDDLTEEKLKTLMNNFLQLAEQGKLKENGWPDNSYFVSKLGVIAMSRIHAQKLRDDGKHNILLNCCCPGWLRTDMGGPKAPKSPEQGADTPVYLATLPPEAKEPHGQYVSEKKIRKI